VVNEVPIFVKGTNWVPLDALHSRDAQHLDQVFPMLVELNCNMARCWGGNVYEQDRFFDLCDDNGILIWQDFAMAGAVYPQDDAFLSAITVEAEAVVSRLRNHPSLALWSGNNECDDAFTWMNPPGAAPVDPNLDRITRQIIPSVLKRLDPDRPYQPSSPYHSPQVFAAGNQSSLMPEVHLWGPRGYFKAQNYTNTPAHFASEIGYHGCPTRSSLEKMFDPEAVHPWIADHRWNDEWLTKSVRYRPGSTSTVGRNDLMIKQVRGFFDAVPDDLDEFILASQICQAEGLKFFIEFWRQQKGSRSGILWWNLRDGWPIVSDAIVDYYNTKKLAFHYVQRAQRDVQAICCEASAGQHSIVVVNDSLRHVRGHLAIRREGGEPNLLELAFEVEPNGKTHIGELPHPPEAEMWHLDWSTDQTGPFASHYLAASGPINLDQYKEWMKQIEI
jgi:beta-mannosidase